MYIYIPVIYFPRHLTFNQGRRRHYKWGVLTTPLKILTPPLLKSGTPAGGSTIFLQWGVLFSIEKVKKGPATPHSGKRDESDDLPPFRPVYHPTGVPLSIYRKNIGCNDYRHENSQFMCSDIYLPIYFFYFAYALIKVTASLERLFKVDRPRGRQVRGHSSTICLCSENWRNHRAAKDGFPSEICLFCIYQDR
jgi:hypothetical protein